MPVYNVQNYLKDSVSDIKKQSFSDFELILVDDCAIDYQDTEMASISDK